MPTPLDNATLVADLMTVATAVAVLISSIIKPLLERIPALSPAQPDQAAHDAALRAANLVLTVAGVLLITATQGQFSLANWLPLLLQVGAAALGAHSVYALVKPSAGSALAGPLSAQANPASLPAPVDTEAI